MLAPTLTAILRPVARAIFTTADTVSGVSGSPPVNTVAPVASGTGTVGSLLSCTDGTWIGTGPITYTYQWQRDGSNIGGATSVTYTLVTADAGTTIVCVVTGTNADGSSSANSNGIAVAAIAPVNTVSPVASGTGTVGSTLSTTNGTWTGTPAPTFTYKWQRDGVDIGGATASTYTLVLADGGTTVRCVVTATNSGGSVSANSNGIAVAAVAPVNTVAPVASGTGTVGSVLSTTNGTWTGTAPITYTYQWQRDGVNIGSATASTYTLVLADGGTTVRCVVTGTNSAGNSSANSNGIAVAAVAPVNTVAPVASGTGTVGSVLSVTTGTWTGTAPITYSYQWQRNGSNIGSATASTYTLVLADDGTTVRCVVTATNAGGANSANSNGIAVSSGSVAPVNTVAPVVTGTGYVGYTLTTTNGTWTGTPTPTYSYQWQRAGVDISGETASTHAVVIADEGVAVRCVVTATNVAGSASANSNVIEQWVPTDAAASPISRYDAADASTITLATGVSAWANKGSLSSDTLSQATGANQPAYSATGFSGAYPGVTFDGTTDFLRRSAAEAAVRNVVGATISAVVNIPSVATAENQLFAIANNNTEQARLANRRSNANLSINARRLDADAQVTVTARSSLSTGQQSWITVTDYSAALSRGYANGAVGSDVATLTAGSTSDTNSARRTMGATTGATPGSYFNGTVAEVVVYNAALGTTDCEKLAGYFAWRWRMVTELTAGNPYKTVPPTP